MAVLVNNAIADKVEVIRLRESTVWCKLDKVVTNTDHDIIPYVVYIPPEGSAYLDPETFEKLDEDLSELNPDGTCHVILT